MGKGKSLSSMSSMITPSFRYNQQILELRLNAYLIVYSVILLAGQKFYLILFPINSFTIEIRLKLAQSLGIDGAFILPVREIHRISSNYYSSFKIQLIDYFGVSISLYSVKPDGNCLYHAVSHLILGNQE